jgi:hypothetical protein
MDIYNKLNVDLQEKVDYFIWDKIKNDFINENKLKIPTPRWLSFRRFKTDFFDIIVSPKALLEDEMLFGNNGDIKTINGFFKILAECSLKLENYSWCYECNNYSPHSKPIKDIMDINKGFSVLIELKDYIINTKKYNQYVTENEIEEYYYELFDCIRLAIDFYCVDIEKNDFIEICKLLHINPVYVFDTAFEIGYEPEHNCYNYPSTMSIYLTEVLKEILSHYIKAIIMTLPEDHILIQNEYGFEL